MSSPKPRRSSNTSKKSNTSKSSLTRHDHGKKKVTIGGDDVTKGEFVGGEWITSGDGHKEGKILKSGSELEFLENLIIRSQRNLEVFTLQAGGATIFLIMGVALFFFPDSIAYAIVLTCTGIILWAITIYNLSNGYAKHQQLIREYDIALDANEKYYNNKKASQSGGDHLFSQKSSATRADQDETVVAYDQAGADFAAAFASSKSHQQTNPTTTINNYTSSKSNKRMTQTSGLTRELGEETGEGDNEVEGTRKTDIFSQASGYTRPAQDEVGEIVIPQRKVSKSKARSKSKSKSRSRSRSRSGSKSRGSKSSKSSKGSKGEVPRKSKKSTKK